MLVQPSTLTGSFRTARVGLVVAEVKEFRMDMKKKMVTLLLAAVVGVGVGAALGYGPLLRYKTEGVLSVEMGTAEYKRFAELANDPANLRQYLQDSPPTGFDKQQLDKLIDAVSAGNWQKPVPKISKADAKELPDILIQIDKDPKVAALVYLGIRLTYVGADPQSAANAAIWLGGYFRDVATREAMREQVSRWASENRQFSDRALERKLKYQFDIEQAQSRAIALKTIVAAYPGMSQRESQQVVEIRKDNEKFLSPLAQLVAAESEVIGVREQLTKLDREIEQQMFIKTLVADAEVAIGKSQSGNDSVINISGVITEFSKKVKSEAQREKLLALAADVSQITARFLSQAQFVAKPSVPTQPEKPMPLVVVLLSTFIFAGGTSLFFSRRAISRMLKPM
jgi:hypothetical protein